MSLRVKGVKKPPRAEALKSVFAISLLLVSVRCAHYGWLAIFHAFIE